MEQMYLIEIFIDKLTIFISEEDEKSSANKSLIIKTLFGPKVQFIIKEGQMARNEDPKDDIVECDEKGKKKFTRIIRAGKSLLFPSYPDTILMILAKFPLEIEVWNDDDKEEPIFVGIGNMHWDTEFFFMLKETTDTCKIHEPLAIKQTVKLWKECCCTIAGEISIIVRISALGDSIITEFQQLMKDPDRFVFRTNKAPSMFECKRVEGDDPNFCMVGSLYETTTLEDPDILDKAQKKIEICTELQSCGMGQKGSNYVCEHTPGGSEKTVKKTYPIDKIRMGDITGPCGNANCTLAHKVKNYIRALDSYKKQAGALPANKDNKTKKICGACSCKDDRYHRDECPSKVEQPPKKGKCSGCGGLVPPGESCDDKKKKMFGTGFTPRHSDTHINYLFSVTRIPDIKQSAFGRDFIEENLGPQFSSRTFTSKPPCSCHKFDRNETQHVACNTNLTSSKMNSACNKVSTRSFGTQQIVFNCTNMNESQRTVSVYNYCTEVQDDKDCKCNPTKPTPPCNTFDCECLVEVQNIAARKQHKPYCPLYKHKPNCPVTMIDEELAEGANEYEDAEAEPLPYGLPPIQLGPCPVLGRPCTVPDGFARMYKTAAMPNLPPSYNEAGKVCCSKEYDRIKKALKEYLKNQKENDFRCINKFNVDTERRCCDKEQQLLSLMGKSCCGSHKMAIQEKFKEDKK